MLVSMSFFRTFKTAEGGDEESVVYASLSSPDDKTAATRSSKKLSRNKSKSSMTSQSKTK